VRYLVTIRTPSRPASSWVNCQATRPEREPRVVAHSSASRSSSEAVRERDLFLNRFARIDRSRALVLDHLARQQMPPVGGRIQDDVIGAPLDAALQHRLQRLVGGIITVERQVVAEHDETKIRTAQQIHQCGEAFDILAVNLDQLQPVGRLARRVDAGMRRLHQRGFSHAARAP
jgi:hypothetical protein